MGALMNQPKNKLLRLFCDEEGATAVEYAIMIVLIILVCIATIAVLGSKVDETFDKFVTEYDKVVT
jgi:pilus assembly protein Flp/PilA